MNQLLRIGSVLGLTGLLQACNPIGFIEANRLLKEDEDSFLAAKADFVIHRPLVLLPNEIVAAGGELELKYRINSLSVDQLVMQRSGHEFSIPNQPTWLFRGATVNLKYSIEMNGGRLIENAVSEKLTGKSIEVRRAVQGRFEAVRITVRDGSEITAQFDGWFPSKDADPVKTSIATKTLYNQMHHPFTTNRQPVSIEGSVGKMNKFLDAAFVKSLPAMQPQTSYRAAIAEDTKYERPVDFDRRASPPEQGYLWDHRCDDFLIVTTRPGAGGYSYRFRHSKAQAQVIVRWQDSIHCYGDEVFIIRNQNGNDVLERYSQDGDFLEGLKIEYERDLRFVLASGGPIVNPTSFERSGTSYRWTYLFVNGLDKHNWTQGKLKALPVSRRTDIVVKSIIP
jgi:hypothetical protein